MFKTNEEIPQKHVITCGDDGVQVNAGIRFGILGAGVKMDGFSKVVQVLKKLIKKDIFVVANAENDWIKDQFDLDDYQQANATMQQQVEALADQVGLKYAGMMPFSDPRQLKFDIKGHMVRPKGVHIASKISFTLAGGEQKYSLDHYVISADWVHKVDKKIVKGFIDVQVKYYKKLIGKKPILVFEEGGELGEKVAAKNRKVLEGLGYEAAIITNEDVPKK